MKIYTALFFVLKVFIRKVKDVNQVLWDWNLES